MSRGVKSWAAGLAVVSLLASAVPTAAQTRTQPAALRTASPELAGFDAARLAKLDAAMKSVVDRGQVAGMVTMLGRHGRLVDTKVYGRKAVNGAPMTEDALFRIYSMTKPITGVGMMILFEEGRWKLDDPVTKYVPEFSRLKAVKSVGPDGTPVLEDLKRPPTMRELMTHTTGLGYGLSGDDPSNKAFRDQGVLRSQGLQQMIDRIAGIPLISQPGEAWRYSAAVDVQGYIIEKLSGQPLDVFFNERIFKPLKMNDTSFSVPAGKVNRLAAVYGVNPQTGALVDVPAMFAQDFTKPPAMFSGGGGLVSTTGDYARFCQMILNGGTLDGARVLSPATVALMGSNHLQPGLGLNSDGRGSAGGMFQPGMGFGLGFSRIEDSAMAGTLAGEGTLAWGGAAGTWFWIDPKNDLFFIGMIQRFGGGGGGPSLGAADMSRALVYQALTDPAR